MEKLTLQQFKALNKKERLEYNLKIFSNAEFDGNGQVTNIQYYNNNGNWIDKVGREINPGAMYRIKPQPQFKPYSKVDKAWVGDVVRYKAEKGEIYVLIVAVYTEPNKILLGNGNFYDLNGAFETLEWQDGSPFGEEIE